MGCAKNSWQNDRKDFKQFCFDIIFKKLKGINNKKRLSKRKGKNMECFKPIELSIIQRGLATKIGQFHFKNNNVFARD